MVKIQRSGPPDDLIPELQEWNDGKGISLPDWIFAVGRYDHAIGYVSIFWPNFFIYDDCVFLGDVPQPDNYASWMSTLHGDRAHVEAMINHLHILDMFGGRDFDPSPELVVYLAGILKEMWSCKLQRDFPERRFAVEVSDGQPDDLLTYEITFFQIRP